MRTFAHFPTDDREHRLLHETETPQPEPTQVEAPTPQAETQPDPVETLDASDAALDAATAEVDTGSTDIEAMQQPIDEVDQILAENPDATEIETQPDVQSAQIDVNTAIDGAAEFIEDTGTTVKQGADQVANFIRGFGRNGETQAPVPPSDYEASPTTEEDASTGSGETETEGSGTPEGKEEFRDEGSGEGRERPAEADKGEKKDKKEGEGKVKESSESKETREKSYEREKGEQKVKQERQKFSEVGDRQNGDPDKWVTIDNGKTDDSGNPFLYKEGTMTVNGQEKPVLLAYSPNGGYQVMDVKTGEWQFLSKMDATQIKGAEGMDIKARDAALAAERKEDPDGYNDRKEQNQRNHDMEEYCLKNIAADPKWFAEHMDDPMWEGNEDIHKALAASLENPDAAASVDKSVEADAEDSETAAEDKEANPKIAELKKLMEEMKKDFEKKFKEMSDLLDKLEGEEGKKKEEGKEDVKEGDKEEDEKDDAVADAQKVLDNPDSTAAQKAEAIKTITDATLDDLDGKSDDKSADTKSDATEPSAKSLDINDVQDIKESPDDKQLRSKLISEVRTDPKKTVEGLTQEKNDAFKKVSDEQTKSIDDQESSITTQEGKVNGIKQQIRDLNQSLGPAKPEEVDGINSKIAALKVDQGVEEGNLAKMEENHTKSVDNLKTLKDNNDKEVKMLGELKTEWEKTAKRTDAKFEEMGEKLLTLNDNVGGKIVQSIDVEHDGSLGLKMTGATNAFEMFLNGMSDIAKYGVIGASVKAAKSILDENEMKKLTVDDNPAPAMKAVNAYVKSLEAKKEAKAK